MSTEASRDPKAARLSVPRSVASLLRRQPWSSMGLSMLVTGAFVMPARGGTPPAAQFGTSAWFAQRLAQPPATRNLTPPAGAGGTVSGVSTPSQAAGKTQQSVQDLNNAAARIRSVLAAQVLAAQSAATSVQGGVPDGLATGGLVLAPPAAAGAAPNQSGISGISQSTQGSKTTVTVTQDASNALVTWNTFNVGRNTTLDFDQSAGTQTNGNNSWVVLNRVLGGNPDGSPSRILGSIHAQGSVYIIDQNGILFGAGSQISTHSLLASSLSLVNPYPGNGLVPNLINEVLSGDAATSKGITVEQGAAITTDEQGFVILAAPAVTNGGLISARDGQVILAAGEALWLTRAAADGEMSAVITAGSGADVLVNTSTGLIQSVKGNITLLGPNIEQDGVLEATTGVTRGGSITLSAGVSEANSPSPTGFGTVGAVVFGSGSVTAVLPEEDGETTTSSQAATQAFSAVAPSLSITGGGVTFAGRDAGGPGALIEAPGATLTVTAVADGTVPYNPSSLLPLAAAGGRIFVGDGATLDVAGLADVELPVADTLLTVGPLTQNDLADSPLVKDGFLYGATVTIDTTVSGVSPNGQAWVGSPLINATGYVQNIPRTIDQLLTNGGTVSLAADQVITARTSSINIAGGYINYLGGLAPSTTRLAGADGRSYDIGSADPTLSYVGFAGQSSATSAHWNITQTYTNPVLAGAIQQYRAGFVQGGAGGALNVSVGGTAILNGGISAGVVAGRQQVASRAQPAGSRLTISNAPGAAVYGTAPPPGPSFDITTGSPDLEQLAHAAGDAAFTSATGLVYSSTDPTDRGNLRYWTPLDAAALSADGFSAISVTSTGGLIVLEPGAALGVIPGGALPSASAYGGNPHDSITLRAGGITLDGSLTARAGTIEATASGVYTVAGVSVDTPGDIKVGAAATLDASGEWVNDAGLSPDQIRGDAFLNGGSIALSTLQSSYVVAGATPPRPADNTGSIDLAPGATLTVASGGYVDPLGRVLMNGSLPAGAGGSISLITYSAVQGGAFEHQPTFPGASVVPGSGSLNIAGANLIGYGFSQGGSLTLQARGIQIGGADAGGAAVSAPETQEGTLRLPTDFFAGGGSFKDAGTGTVTTVAGFGSYVLNAVYDASVAGGADGSPATVTVSQRNLIPQYAALVATATGANILTNGATQIGTVDAYDRAPTNLTLTAGDYRDWGPANATTPPDYSSAGITGTLRVAENAALVADPGARIVLGSPGTVEVLGSITAHGGSITLDGLSGSRRVASTADGGLADAPATPAQAVLIGPHAQLDVSGTFLLNPFVKPVVINGQPTQPVTGTVLPGGSLSLYGTTVAAAPGSVLDVSGTTAVLDVPQNVTSVGRQLAGVYAPTLQWSDAGSITVGASDSLYLESTLRGQPGSGPGGTGSGATFTITDLGPTGTVELFQSTGTLAADSPLILPVGWQPGDALASAGGILYLAAGGLSESGIWNLRVNSNARPTLDPAAPGPDPTTGEGYPGNLALAFAGGLDLQLRGSLVADASAYRVVAAPGGQDNASPATASIAAPYIALDGYYDSSLGSSPAVPGRGSGTLIVGNLDPGAGPVTQLIDLGGRFSLQDIAQASFASAGGIRFLTSSQFDFLGTSGTDALTGQLISAGDLTFTAAALYPASGNRFAIVAGGARDADGQLIAASITINATPGTQPRVPLSAGGSLLLDADTITQNGTIWAPAGSLVLGVGNPADAATQALFGSSALIATSQVTLGAGSRTSVSLGGATLPYGTTVDAQEWQYDANPVFFGQVPDLSAPPAKLIQIDAVGITLSAATNGRPAAVIDLSGGGTLQAVEWVPGVGGTRDVLSQYNTSYSNGAAGEQVPLYPDQRGIYALVPGYEVPVAAYDPVFAQGQAPIGVGESITISGGHGIPAGTYVLMPAKYATLPGAYRVVQHTGLIDSVPAQNTVQADGTQLISGYYSNALTGARESRSVTFELQATGSSVTDPAGVWEKYSQYTAISADTFFAALASNGGVAIPQLPRDAGQLVLGASGSLILGATLDTAAATGGAAAQVDIASLDIQITGGGATALPGYLQLSAGDLDSLGAGSLLIGGTRTRSSAGIQIEPLAQSIVVSNDASSPLKGDQILLVASDSVQVEGGSVIQAAATGTPAPGTPIIIGTQDQAGSGNGALLMVSSAGPVPLSRVSSAGTGTLSVGAGAELSGGGFLLLDSAGNTAVDGSAKLSGHAIAADAGSITFTAGAGSQGIPGMVVGPETLALFSQASQVSLRSYGSIDFEGDLDIAIGTAPGNSLELSAAAFTAGALGNPGSAVSISAPTLILTNDLGAQTSLTPTAGATALALRGSEIDFGSGGSGTAVFSGFSSVNVAAQAAATSGGSAISSGVVTRGGTFNFGNLGVTVNAPVILAAGGTTTTLATTGTLTLGASADAPLSTRGELGGQLTLSGGSLHDSALIEAPAGNLSLIATTGTLLIDKGAGLSTAGAAVPFYDITEYAPAGVLSLTAQQGDVEVSAGATLDFAGAAGGGDAGALSVSAPLGTASLLGTLKGGAAPGYAGGSVSIVVGGSEDLDTLAQLMRTSGATRSLSVISGTGDLVLGSGNTLTVQTVSLVAGNGSVIIEGAGGGRAAAMIDADGRAGGTIALYGSHGVDVGGTLQARARSESQLGGSVILGTATIAPWNPATGTLDARHGYESVDPSMSGVITLEAGAVIDVSGGSAGGRSGGTVSFRAPLLSTGDVNITVAPGARIIGATGAGSVSVEPYAVWSTVDPVGDPAQHFDGIIDPAGWYDSSGHLVNGTFYNQDGLVVASGSDLCPDPATCSLLSDDYFVPAAANAAHQSFYGYLNGDAAQGPGTLMSFIEAPGFSDAFQSRMNGLALVAGSGRFAVTPGVELDNPVSAGVNGGDIKLLTNWNLGAGPVDAAGVIQGVYRYQGAAPVLTLRAGNNLVIDASLTDGFHQYGAGPELTYLAAQYAAAVTLFQQTQLTPAGGSAVSVNLGSGVVSYDLTGIAGFVAFATPAQGQSGDYYAQYAAYRTGIQSWLSDLGRGTATQLGTRYPYTIDPAILGAGAPRVSGYPATAQGYQSYLGDYHSWLTSTYTSQATLGALGTTPPPPQLPPAGVLTAGSQGTYQQYMAAWTTYASYVNTLDGLANLTMRNGAVFAYIFPPLPPPAAQATLTAAVDAGNSPTSMRSLQNVAPVAFGQVSGGASASYRLVAGGDLASPDPLALQPAAVFAADAGGGSVLVGGHTDAVDESTGLEMLFPTTIRTGQGGIAVAAGRDIALSDALAPGVIYTAGVPLAGTLPGPLGVATQLAGAGRLEHIVAPAVNSDAAGGITLLAQNDIRGVELIVDTTGAITGAAGTRIGQSWPAWLQADATRTRSSVNFSAFDQGVLSVGGNVSVVAGGDIADFAVSLPGTWTISSDPSGSPLLSIHGGGNLSVIAGGDIDSGSYYVSRGTALIQAGGAIQSDLTLPATGALPESELAPLLGLQDGQLQIKARNGIDLGGIYDPSYLGNDQLPYSTGSSVSVLAVSGDVRLLTLTQSPGPYFFVGTDVLPATVVATALQGGISVESPGALFPSPQGELSLIANGDIHLFNANAQLVSGSLQMIDADPLSMPSPLNPGPAPYCTVITACGSTNYLAHMATPLHADDSVPVRIYSNGSIINERPGPGGLAQNPLLLSTDKATLIYAGHDIVNLSFAGQNVRASDVTRIVAGHDIYDTPLINAFSNVGGVNALLLGGPGTFDIEAGRNIGPLTNQSQAVTQGYVSRGPGGTVSGVATGINAVGNEFDPYLAHQSADIDVLFGVGPGINTSGFITRYIGTPGAANPGVTAIVGVPDYSGNDPSNPVNLVAFMEAYEAGLSATYSDGLKSHHVSSITLTPAQAWAAYQELPAYVQQLFVNKVFSNLLFLTGQSYNDPVSPYFHQYARGYDAINTLFPSGFGYTANNLTGGTNGSNAPVTTGNLDLRSSTIQTQQGGDITIFGPGGEALLGSASAPPYFQDAQGRTLSGPNSIGILTLEQGSINIYTDRSVLLAQSRVFTEQGGDILMWSSNGDVNAGNGVKSSSFVPPLSYTCDPFNYCIVDPAGEVTGAGIATLQTIAGAPPGDVELIAPRGTVDAGQAGIRVSGNLTIAALHVANVFNIQVQGAEVGIPSSLVDTGQVLAAQHGAIGADQTNLLRPPPAPAATQVDVEVVGYGSPDDDQEKQMKRENGPQKQDEKPASPRP